MLVVSLGWSLNDAHAKKAYLVTYGPGDAVWEWFGHNAIWLQDADQGLDHTFSFGYFDLEASGFYGRFIEGEMRYFGSSVAAQREFDFYRRLNRSIRVQELNLSDEQFDQLQRLLTQAIYPYPQYYDYDYYQANCSTWLRDLINETTNNALAEALQSSPAQASFREHTANQTRHHPAAYLGLMALLGPMVDQPITQWEEAFLPAALAEQVTQVVLPTGPLVVSDSMVYQSQDHAMEGLVVAGPGALLAWGLILAGLVLMPNYVRARVAWLPMGLAIAVLSVSGLMILGMMALTAHEVVRGNLLLMVLHPFWLGLLPIWPRLWRRAAWWICLLLLIGGSVGWLSGLLGVQDGRILWLVTPVILAILWLSHRVLWSDQNPAPSLADG